MIGSILMHETSPADSQPEPDALEIATDQAIVACDGDLRATVQALIVANGLLEAELKDVYAAASNGHARGRAKRKQLGNPGTT
jgi:hypothetical protein